jgi:hypothetical protein
MKPIEIRILGMTRKSSQELCVEILDTERWSGFQGYAILPGIEHAYFEKQTSDWIGSRINVQNKDGSSHIEEIIDWDMGNRVALRLQEFNSPIQHLATHFVETWEFSQSAHGTEVARTITLYPKNTLGWLMLLPISRLMTKALEKHLVQLGCESCDPSSL